jgi:hypothetical protein
MFADFDASLVAPTDTQWRRDVEELSNQRLAGTACRLVRERNLPLPSAAITALRNATFDWSVVTTSARQHAGAAQELLSRAGIPSVLTKGIGIALHYPTLLERPFSDVDFLVERAHFRGAMSVLRSEGYVEAQRNRSPRPELDRYTREAVNLESPSGGKVDVHQRLPPWLWSDGLTVRDMLRRATHVPVDGQRLIVASPEDNLLVSALHVVSDRDRPGSTLLAWRDVQVLLDVARPDTLAALARASGMVSWLRWIVSMLPPTASGDRLTSAMAAMTADLRHPRRLRALVAPRRLRGHPITRVLRLPSPRAAVYLAASLAPSAEYRDFHRGGAPASRAQALLASARRIRSYGSDDASHHDRSSPGTS